MFLSAMYPVKIYKRNREYTSKSKKWPTWANSCGHSSIQTSPHTKGCRLCVLWNTTGTPPNVALITPGNQCFGHFLYCYFLYMTYLFFYYHILYVYFCSPMQNVPMKTLVALTGCLEGVMMSLYLSMAIMANVYVDTKMAVPWKVIAFSFSRSNIDER